MGFEKVWFPVWITTIATAGLIAAIAIAQLNATACLSVTSLLDCVCRSPVDGNH